MLKRKRTKKQAKKIKNKNKKDGLMVPKNQEDVTVINNVIPALS